MPLGQGLIGLTTYLGVGGGNLSLYSITSLLVLTTLLLAIGFDYRRTRFLVPIAPSIVLWFSTRSLSEYVLIGAYALLAALCCWRSDVPSLSAPSQLRARHRKSTRVRKRVRKRVRNGVGLTGRISLTGLVLIAMGTAATAGALTVALTTRAPLSVQIESYHSTGQEQTIDSLLVRVENNSNVGMDPVFVVEDGPYVGTPWILAGAKRVIPPHGDRVVKILAPNTSVMPGLNSAFKVAAFTSGPSAVSTSASFLPNDDHTLITPFGFSGVMPVGKTMTIKVKVLDRLGNPVRERGIEVQLGQAVYSPQGLFVTENSINGHPDGQSPVGSITNTQGVATFNIRADQTQTTATTLQAWLGKRGASGYSNRVVAWFGYPIKGAGG